MRTLILTLSDKTSDFDLLRKMKKKIIYSIVKSTSHVDDVLSIKRASKVLCVQIVCGVVCREGPTKNY